MVSDGLMEARRHQVVSHDPQGAHCPLCWVGFKTPGSLPRHALRWHPELFFDAALGTFSRRPNYSGPVPLTMPPYSARSGARACGYVPYPNAVTPHELHQPPPPSCHAASYSATLQRQEEQPAALRMAAQYATQPASSTHPRVHGDYPPNRQRQRQAERHLVQPTNYPDQARATQGQGWRPPPQQQHHYSSDQAGTMLPPPPPPPQYVAMVVPAHSPGGRPGPAHTHQPLRTVTLPPAHSPGGRPGPAHTHRYGDGNARATDTDDRLAYQVEMEAPSRTFQHQQVST